MPRSAVNLTPTFTDNLTNLSVNMPATGTKKVVIPAGAQSFKLYDDGGQSGNYSDYCNGTFTLTAPTGYRLQLSGNITTEYLWDKLSVYDGINNQANTLLNEVTSSNHGVKTAITTVVSSGQSMTLNFSTNGTSPYAGLDLTVTVFNDDSEFAISGLGAATNGSIAASVGGNSTTTAKYGDAVTLTATPSEGYVLSSVSVTDVDMHTVSVDHSFWASSATFTMPRLPVTVTPTFTNDLYINMPKTGESTYDIPAHVSSFKVYDDGGSGGNYSPSCDGYLVLTVPAGYRLQLSGNVSTEVTYDYLTVYDGINNQADVLVNQVSSSLNNGNSVDIPTVISTGQSMTIFFHSDNGSGNSEFGGLNLTVTLIDLNKEYAINGIGDVTNGNIVATVGGEDAQQAKFGNEVTLNITPAEDYILSSLSVVDANSQAVSVNWSLGDNTATFTMPYSAVTVIPTFTINANYSISGIGEVTNGSIVATVGGNNATQAKENDVVALTVTPDNGYVLTDLSVVDGNSNAVTVIRDFWANTATFTMPASAVTVTPTFTNNPSINMPVTGTMMVNLPSNIQSFKVYGDEGYDKYYSNNCDGTLTLTAPEGYVLQISGRVETWNAADYLIVYDGTSAAAELISKSYNYTDIPTKTSTGRSMTICFVSDSYNNNGDGPNLTVTLINTNTLYDISGIGNVTNGNIAATVGGEDATQAKFGDVVTLNVTPADGYVLTDLSVVDGSSNAVTVTREFWANTATFTMPGLEVTVTSTFTNEPYINMPATGERTYGIPAHVSSFKVYDNGGKNGNYSDYCNGTLVLTAPDGYVLQLSGSILTESNDKLTVYDGIDEHADILIDQLKGDNETSKAIPTVVSTDRYMTINFYSDYSTTYAGLDLTVTFISVNNVQLANDADNSAVISDNNGLEANVTLAGRTLSMSGEWNTLCLPFSLASLTGTPLEGAVV